MVEPQGVTTYLALELAARAIVDDLLPSSESDAALGMVERERRRTLSLLHSSSLLLSEGEALGWSHRDFRSLRRQLAELLRNSSSAAALYLESSHDSSGGNVLTVRIREGFESAFASIDRSVIDGTLDAVALGRALDDIRRGLDRAALPDPTRTWLFRAAGDLDTVLEDSLTEGLGCGALLSSRLLWCTAEVAERQNSLFRSAGLVVAPRELLLSLESMPHRQLNGSLDFNVDPLDQDGTLGFLIARVDEALRSAVNERSAPNEGAAIESALGDVRASARLAFERSEPSLGPLLQMLAVPLEMEAALALVGIEGARLAAVGFGGVRQTAAQEYSVWADFRQDIARWAPLLFGPSSTFLRFLRAHAGPSEQDRLPGFDIEFQTQVERQGPSSEHSTATMIDQPAVDPTFDQCVLVHRGVCLAVTSVEQFLRGNRPLPDDNLARIVDDLPASASAHVKGEFARLLAVVAALRDPRPLYHGVDLIPDWRSARPSVVKLGGLRLLADTTQRLFMLIEEVIAEAAPEKRADFASLGTVSLVGPTPAFSQDTLDVLGSVYFYAARIDYRASRNAAGEVGHVAGIWEESEGLLELLRIDSAFLPQRVLAAVQPFTLALSAQRKPRLRPAAIRADNMALAMAARDLMRAVDDVVR